MMLRNQDERDDIGRRLPILDQRRDEQADRDPRQRRDEIERKCGQNIPRISRIAFPIRTKSAHWSAANSASVLALAKI